MTVGAQVFAVCDVRRTAAGAASPTRLELDAVLVEDGAAALAELRAEAVPRGWTSARCAGEPRHACLDGSRSAASDWAHPTERWRAAGGDAGGAAAPGGVAAGAGRVLRLAAGLAGAGPAPPPGVGEMTNPRSEPTG